MGIARYSRGWIRENSVRHFAAKMADRHPELADQVRYDDFLRMADRDQVIVRLATLPARQHARTFVIGEHHFIRINRSLSRDEQTLHGMHELCHVWRDQIIDGAYYSDELTGGARCEFADIFAWRVTSTPRQLRESQLDLDF